MEKRQRYKDELLKRGFTNIPLEDGPFNKRTLQTIKESTCPIKVTYSLTLSGDLGEPMNLNYFRILHPDMEIQTSHEILNILENETFKNDLEILTGLSKYTIDRCQAHYYGADGFVSKHVDANRCPDWAYTLVLSLTPAEEGGEFVLSLPHDGKEEENIVTHLKEGELMIFDSRLPHQVLPVRKGYRRSFAFFMNTKTT